MGYLKAADRPVPMSADNRYISSLELALRPQMEKDRQNLQTTMGLSYQQTIGELIFALVICRLDISTAAKNWLNIVTTQQKSTMRQSNMFSLILMQQNPEALHIGDHNQEWTYHYIRTHQLSQPHKTQGITIA